VLDEATAHLDAVTGDALAAEIPAATDGRAALVVTPRPDQVAGLSVVEMGDARRCTPAGAATR
jgi:ATP-binding cassette subfamily C protein CydCD